MDRLGLRYLSIALDAKTHNYFNHHNIHNLKLPGIVAPHRNTSENSHRFFTSEFNLISLRKMEAVYKIMQLGYDVFFLDTDVVLVNDPASVFIWDNVDYVFGINAYCTQG